MNHIYRSIWSETLSVWIAVPELVRGHGKPASKSGKLLATGLMVCSMPTWALPTGDQLVAGQASVSTPNANLMQIQQSSQKAIIDWQSFSLQANEAVNIQQPNAQAALLNRVVGQDASQIQGQLNANGQVYLVNPNGVIFGQTAQVDVGGLIASTHNISNAGFMNDTLHFIQDGATGTVENHGTINTSDGGVVALIGQSVTNTGNINTPKGTTVLAAGKTVDLDFQGNGLVEIKVSEAALNAQITNRGAIQADGGRVVLTAKAAGQLIDTVINQQGIVRAQGLVERNGEIILDGGNNGITQISGTLDTSSQQTGGTIKVSGDQLQIQNTANINASGNSAGSHIVIGDKQSTRKTTLQQGASLNAQVNQQGNAGTIEVFANMSNGTLQVDGELNAAAPNSGNGGFIDTSAAQVKIADSAKITTKAAHGNTGTWLIDPNDYTIAATGGNITGAALSAALNSTAVTISTATQGTSGGNGDIFVNDVVSWVANTLLTLNAERNININATITGLGASSQLALLYGQSSLTGNASDDYFINNGATINLAAGPNFSTQKGSNIANLKNYTVITTLGAENSVTGSDLQGINGNPTLNYALGADIDASPTATWAGGFNPLSTVPNFEGLGHSISNLTINRPATNNVGLFGNVGGGAPGSYVRNFGLLANNITGQDSVGGIAGGMLGSGGIISNVYTTGNVTGNNAVGGLTGSTLGGSSISNSYTTGNVTGNTNVGGIVGSTDGNVLLNTYAAGNVTGNDSVGGLVGISFASAIGNSYTTTKVTGNTNVGGLIGGDSSGNTINNCFWGIQATGQSVSGFGSFSTLTNVSGKTTAEMMQMATFSNTGWDISNTGGSSAVWRIYEGSTTPLLRSFLVPLVVTANTNISETYTGLVHGSLNNINYSIPGAVSSGHLFNTATPFGNAINVGTYTLSALYSDPQGYDIIASGILTITPAPLIVTANPFSKTYDALAFFGGNGVTYTGLVNGETSSVLTGNLNYAGSSQGASNAGSYDIIPGGLSSGNYSISYVNGLLTINPAELTLMSSDITKLFDGTTLANGFPLVVNGKLFGIDTLFGGIYRFTDANVGISKTVTLSNVQIDDRNGGKNYRVTYINNNNGVIKPNPVFNEFYVSQTVPLGVIAAGNMFYASQTVPLQNSTSFLNWYIPELQADKDNKNDKDDSEPSPASELSVNDNNSSFSGTTSNFLTKFIYELADEKKPIHPVLQVKNSAGQVKRLQVSKDRQFLSLLLEDGSVRIWDFQSGMQRQIDPQDKNRLLTDITSVDENGEALGIASKNSFSIYDVTSPSTNEQEARQQTDIQHFTRSDDGSLLLLHSGDNELRLWDDKQDKELWQTPHKRGTVNNLALSHDKHYGAVLSTQPGVYELSANSKKFKPLTDAVDIVDLHNGEVIKSLPNTGEQVIYMRFKDDKTLQLGLVGGKLFDWDIVTGSKKTVANFPETVVAVDNDKDTYAYVSRSGGVRVGDGQEHIHLSIENKDNPFKYVQLVDDGKKLLTVLNSGDLSLWDVESGEKMLRLFSSKQGWTVMDALGRFDGSEEAMENFSWLANEENIPLDYFSENYYEPGLLSSVMQNQDYLNNAPNKVVEGISLPPKVELQLAEQQSKGDKVNIKMDVYNRGGGIDQVNIYHNGKIIGNPNQQKQAEDSDEHITTMLNISPTAGKNTVKVVASNDMGIENTSSKLGFDGKTRAYNSTIRLLTVGIDQYSDQQINLLYSVADANAISEAFKTQSKIAASENLTDGKATKPKILAELRKLSQGVQQDVLVIYFAGHGIAVDKEWFFLPYETKLKPTLEQIVEAGITASELSNIFKDSKIQHIMLMVDSCYSGAGIDVIKFKKQQDSQRYFARKMSRNLGITIIAAAAKDQEANELASLGHGLFTYTMMKELEKKDENTPLTAHGIAESIIKTLPAFSKKVLGIIQDPVVYTRGDDFMLIDASKNKK
jgi:filamentous hemagglutinin family protein